MKIKPFYKYLLRVWGIDSRSPVYMKALQHKSVDSCYHNERLELLGDTVLELIVTDELFRQLPEEDEGALSQIRSNIVSRKTLNSLGDKLGMRPFIECQPNLKDNPDLSGNAIEAMIGAMYLDLKWEKTRERVLELIKSNLDWDKLCKHYKNEKTVLYEWAQSKKRKIKFDLLKQETENGQQIFNIALILDGKVQLKKRGTNKKALENELATEFLAHNSIPIK